MPPDPGPPPDEWEWLLRELDRIHDAMKDMSKQISDLKVKAGLWGAAGAAIPVLLMICIQLFLR